MEQVHFQVFWIGNQTGWATAEFDEQGNQIGDAVFSFSKKDAIKEARAAAGGCFPIAVFQINGEVGQIINTATVGE